MRNILLEIAYFGGVFYGFQRQKEHQTVQGLLEHTLSEITGEKIMVVGAGRTDRGVHAFAQICNFYTASELPAEKIRDALNALLPQELRVNRAEEVPLDFHARKKSRGKIYTYLVWNGDVMSPFLLNFAYYYPYLLDLAKMRKALEQLSGEQDFRSFAKVGVYKRGTKRTLYRAAIVDDKPLLIFILAGSGFLQHMARIIVGTILEIGRGKIEPNQIQSILQEASRSAAGPTAPSCGLYLVSVIY